MRRVISTSLTLLLMGSAGSAFANGPSSFPSALPPVANPGECYAQVRIPAQYESGSETVVTSEGYSKLEVTDPQFQSRREGVMTKEASTRYVVRQPSYRTVSERVLTRPAHERLSVSQPQFSTVTEELQTSGSHLVWKRGNPGELQRQGYIIHSTADGRFTGSTQGSQYQGGSYATTQNGGDRCGPGCEIWCLVEEPGTSVTTTRRVMSAPARITRTPVAPEYVTIRKEIVTDHGGVEEIPVPAEWASVEIHDLVRPAEAYEVNVPAEMGQVETKNLVSPERYEWRRVLCQPGAGTIRSGGSYHSSGHQSSGTSYSSGSVSSSVYQSTPQYSQQSYSHTVTPSEPVITQQPEPRTGYYGTEDFPAYQHRVPHRKRR